MYFTTLSFIVTSKIQSILAVLFFIAAMMSISTSQKELWQISWQWLLQTGNRVNKNFALEEITAHPDYPALTALTDFLDAGGMQYNAVYADASHIYEFNYPLLAHIKQHGNEYLHIIQDAAAWDTQKEITAHWSGITIYPEKQARWKHKDNDAREQEEYNNRIYLFSVGLAMMLLYGWAIYYNRVIDYALFGLLSLAGLLVSILVTGAEIGVQNSLVKQVCGAVSNGGCDKVLKTNYAKGIMGFTTSDLAIIYFATQYITWLATGLYPPLFNSVVLISLAGVIVVTWSIYTQAVALKQWCALCLAIAGVLLLQHVLSVFEMNKKGFANSFNWRAIAIFTAIAGLFALLVVPVKKMLVQNHLNAQKLAELKKWKMDASVFKAQWLHQKVVDITIWKNDLLLGNRNAPILITVACNPFCGPCAKAHKQLDELLIRYKDKLCVQVRFLCNPANSEDRRTIAVKAILQNATQINTNGKLDSILTDWFETMDYNKWITRWHPRNNTDVQSCLEQHENWINNAGVTFTPTFFINGKELPSRYGLAELEILLPQLEYEFTNEV